MEILWWLAPAFVVTALAMCWVGWLGRESRGAVDRDAATARLGVALRTQHKGLQAAPAATRRPDRSTGVAVRRSRSSGAAGPGPEPVADPEDLGRRTA